MAKHGDCMNYTQFDVFKGMCRKNKGFVFNDIQACNDFSEGKRCKNCACFSKPNNDDIGVCTGLAKEYWAYGSQVAKYCEGYKAKQ